jgi:hypothetical protein
MSVASTNLLPQPIETFLAGLARRRVRLSLARAAGRALSVTLLWTLLCCVLDRFLHLSAGLRSALVLGNVGAVVAILARPLYAAYVSRDVDWIDTSELAERLDASLGQRLSTATSRLLGPRAYRGSDAMLGAVVDDAAAAVGGRDARPLLPTKVALGPWAMAGAMFLVYLILLPVSWLGLPQLVARYVSPFGNVQPVTTTRLDVTPGSTSVEQGTPMMVGVSAERLGDGVPRVSVSADGHTWSRHLMTPGAAGGFVHRLDPLGQDVRYYVTGGDATSPTYDVRVLRKPLPTEFRVRYTYPAYTRRQPLTVSNRTGLIEAPVGTEAVVTVTASEPLSGGQMKVGKNVVELTRTLDDRSRQAKLTIEADADYTLKLTSERGAVSELKAAYRVRAIPDRPPLVRVADSGGDGPRPGPRDLVPVTYQTLDDYGVEEVVVVARVNGGEPVRIPLKIRGDARRQEETYPLDLAPLGVKVGDVVAVTVEARDGRGQVGKNDPAVVALVSPRAIDVNAHQRVVELEAAASVAERLVTALDGAGKALDRAAAAKPVDVRARVAANAGANRGVTSAGESAAVLRQSLLRATLRSASNEMSVTLGAMLDGAQLQLLDAERLVGIRGIGADAVERRARLNDTLARATQLRDALKTLAAGERAAAAAAERENVAAAVERAKDPAYPFALKAGVTRMAKDFADTLRGIGIDPGAGNVPELLKARVDAADALMKSQSPPDFAKASGAWARAVTEPHAPTGFEARLSTAAQAESIRPDADLVRARDLQVSAEAAGRIERDEVPPTTRPTDPLPTELYPASMLALQRYHETNRPMEARPSSDEVEARKLSANIGRDRMRKWAGLDAAPVDPADQTGYPAPSDPPPSAESLTSEASSAAARKDYRTVAKIDRLLAKLTPARSDQSNRSPTDPSQDPMPATTTQPTESRAEQTMVVAQRIDELAAHQQSLAEETKLAKPEVVGDLAARQATIGEAISEVQQLKRLDLRGPDDPDWREAATAAIQSAQEQLAAMPQALNDTARAVGHQRQAVDRLDKAKQAATTLPVEAKTVGERAVAQARRDVDAAANVVTDVGEPIAPSVAETMSARLAKYAPSTTGSVEAIDKHLLPALRSTAQATGSADETAFARSAEQTRRGIERVQAALAEAQDELIERNPLVAAKWFARAAARSLEKKPPALVAAERQQRAAAAALTKAWDRSIHQAANERLAGVQSMTSVFSFFPVDVELPVDAGAGPGASDRIMSLVPTARQWGFVRPDGVNPADAVRRESDPPGFEEPIRLYFEALGRTREGK